VQNAKGAKKSQKGFVKNKFWSIAGRGKIQNQLLKGGGGVVCFLDRCGDPCKSASGTVQSDAILGPCFLCGYYNLLTFL
jgi:hypothetical protein